MAVARAQAVVTRASPLEGHDRLPGVIIAYYPHGGNAAGGVSVFI